MFGQGVMKRMFSKSGALEPHPTETHFQWGRPTGLGTCSGARRRVASTRCTKTGSSYPVAPRWLAPGGWEEWETRKVEFESKGRPDGCPSEYRKPGVMLCGGYVCVKRDGPWPARRLCERRKNYANGSGPGRPSKKQWTFVQVGRRIFQRATTDLGREAEVARSSALHH